MKTLIGSIYGVLFVLAATNNIAAQTMIYDVNDLQNMQNNLAGDYVLANDIDASGTVSWNSGAGFLPVGTISDWFTGTFDGAGHTISGLYINRPTFDYCGLFGITFGTCSNVSLVNANINGFLTAGCLCGNGGTVTNCHASGTVTAGSAAGGLAGFFMGPASNCSANCTVNGNTSGGLAGSSAGTITGCYATGTVTGQWAGGLIGYAKNRVENSYSTATVSGSRVGGLIGVTENVYQISNCYSTGAVSGDEAVGGLVGRIMAGGITELTIALCYSSGAVSGSGLVGGLIGAVDEDFFHINTFWDIETSGQADAYGTGGGALWGKTTVQMKQQATFSGFDFGATWGICENATYPFLQALPDFQPAGPIAVTINQGSTQADPANTLPFIFDVAFSAPVTGFDNTDLDFSAGASTVTSYTVTDNGDGMNYTVEVTTVSGEGAIIATVPPSVGANSCTGFVNGSSTSTDNTITYDITPPTADTIAATTGSPAQGGTVSFDVQFSEGTQNFNDESDLVITETGTVAHTGVAISGGPQNYTVDITGVLGDGDVTLTVSTSADVQDLAGVPLDSSVTSAPVVIDNTPPDITIGSPSQATVSTGGSVDFTADYTGEASSWLTETDITLDTTGDANATVTVSSMKDSSYIVTLDNITGTGTLGFTIAAATADDTAGNFAPEASTPTLVTVEPGVPINAIPVAVSLLGVGIFLLKKRQHRK